MLLNKVGRMALLFDFYGSLLTTKQQEIIRFYYEQDLSYGEIATELGNSRQAVADNLKRAEHAMEKYEQKMQLLADYLRDKEE
jgi:predicted DNA-binding protein YlxM (UPF0122 family)